MLTKKLVFRAFENRGKNILKNVQMCFCMCCKRETKEMLIMERKELGKWKGLKSQW